MEKKKESNPRLKYYPTDLMIRLLTFPAIRNLQFAKA